METEDLRQTVSGKLHQELERYREYLSEMTASEVLSHARDYAVREAVVHVLDNSLVNFQEEELRALANAEKPLEGICQSYGLGQEKPQMIAAALTFASEENQREEERRRAMRDLPVYRKGVAYAQEHGELEQYFKSYNANIACRDAIADAVSRCYHDHSLDTASASKLVTDAFGYDRALFVLASTMIHKEWDGRISTGNIQWAKNSGAQPDIDPTTRSDLSVDYLADRPHPGLINMLTTHMRREYLSMQPLTEQEIAEEARRVTKALRAPEAPNSPSGTHFMAQLSPDFLLRAGTGDLEKLRKGIPFRSVSFSGLNGRKGLYAMLSGKENRDQPEKKASVMEKLSHQKSPASRQSSPSRRTKKEQER